jgi:hypothetical protein
MHLQGVRWGSILFADLTVACLQLHYYLRVQATPNGGFLSSEKAIHRCVGPFPVPPEQLDPPAVLSHDLHNVAIGMAPGGAPLLTLKNRCRVHGGKIRSANLIVVTLLVGQVSNVLC